MSETACVLTTWYHDCEIRVFEHAPTNATGAFHARIYISGRVVCEVSGFKTLDEASDWCHKQIDESLGPAGDLQKQFMRDLEGAPMVKIVIDAHTAAAIIAQLQIAQFCAFNVPWSKQVAREFAGKLAAKLPQTPAVIETIEKGWRE